MYEKQTTHFEDFSASFPAEVVAKWEEMLRVFEANPKDKPNPYAEPKPGKNVNRPHGKAPITYICHYVSETTVSEAHLRLAKEEEAEAARTKSTAGFGDTAFLIAGMELEEQQ